MGGHQHHNAVDRDGNIYQLRDYNIAGDPPPTTTPPATIWCWLKANSDEEAVSEGSTARHRARIHLGGEEFLVSVSIRWPATGKSPPGPPAPEEPRGTYDSPGDASAESPPICAHWLRSARCGPAADERVAAIEAGR